ncbi:MAG: hypothetical protein OXI41_01470 [Chloroflexota bacterium]|nr:hypothetical protein [Chloroflexota bacterium]
MSEVFGAEGFRVGEVWSEVVDAVLVHGHVELFEGFEVLEGVGFLFHRDPALAFLAAVGDLVEGVDEEAEFSGGGDLLLVQVGIGVLEGGDGVDEEVGGEGLGDLGAVGFEVADVLSGRRVGAVHALADLSVGESLAAEAVGSEAFGSLGGVHWGRLSSSGAAFAQTYRNMCSLESCVGDGLGGGWRLAEAGVTLWRLRCWVVWAPHQVRGIGRGWRGRGGWRS